MGKVFLDQWLKATQEAKIECALLLDMPVDEVERLMGQRALAFIEKEENDL